MVEESLKEYPLVSAEAVYEDPGKQALMGFTVPGGESPESRNGSH